MGEGGYVQIAISKEDYDALANLDKQQACMLIIARALKLLLGLNIG
jgi:hypothetical protein